MKNYLLFFIVVFSASTSELRALPDAIGTGDGIIIKPPEFHDPIPGLPLIIESEQKNRLVAAALALTLGMVGAHRIYLGTKLMVPVVYIVTLGGGLGLLPLIDTIMILTVKDLSEFENNPKVFMWMK